jgi:Zn-dependent protease
MKNKFFRKIPKAFYTIASLSALAAINYTIFQNSMVFIFLLVLLAHELGHYFIAKKHKAIVSLPIFLPLPFFAIALTKVKNLVTFKSKRDVALAGPIVGASSALLILCLNILFKFTSSMPILFLFLGELIFNYIGSDGARYRQAKKGEALCIC